MLRLGGPRTLTIVRTDPATKEKFEIQFEYQAPTSDEINQYIAYTASTKGETEEQMAEFMRRRISMACAKIEKVHGIEAEDGMTELDTLIKFGGPILQTFASYIFEGAFSVGLKEAPDPGKSPAPSGPRSTGGSARSRGRRASGSSR